jgi:phage shock protein PspC (stress-responsive transcriptional regulator)
MRELKLEDLSTKQKLGMVNTAMIGGACTKEDLEYLLDMVRNHAIGSIWVQWDQKWDHQTAEGYIKMVREVADYPIIIMTDAESGIGEYLGIDPNLIRLGWAAISLFAGSGVVLYIIAAVILPEGEREEKDLNDILHPEQEDRE